jgi:hypothetical protein
MTIEALVQEINTHKQILKGYENALYTCNLKELCDRLRQTCTGIVKAYYDWEKTHPGRYHIERHIAGMSIDEIMNKSWPIVDIEWSINEHTISAYIIFKTVVAVKISFPINEADFRSSIASYDMLCAERKARDQKLCVKIYKIRNEYYNTKYFIKDQLPKKLYNFKKDYYSDRR